MLDSELAESVRMGRSFSEGSLIQTRTSVKSRNFGCSSKKSESSTPRKGQRVFGEAAEELLQEFGDVIMAKYGNVQTAFRALDLNGSGTISGAEFVMNARPIFRGDAMAVFKVLDGSRNGNISVDEFEVFKNGSAVTPANSVRCQSQDLKTPTSSRARFQSHDETPTTRTSTKSSKSPAFYNCS